MTISIDAPRGVCTSAAVIADSVTHAGSKDERLTTVEVTLHRFVLAELNTHRAFSRNSASSRAIPVEKQLERVFGMPAWPLEWPCEQPGMQGGDALEGEDRIDAFSLFSDVWDYTTDRIAEYLEAHPDKSARLHKSLINRLLEPFMWHTVIISSTAYGWENFFAQRCSPLAQPEIRVAADMIRNVYDASVPETLKVGEWHTPYIREEEDFDLLTRLKVSTARCARVSYLNHDGVRDVDADLGLYDKLVAADPPHASPLEHVATPALGTWELTDGNFDGWYQLRHQGLPK